MEISGECRIFASREAIWAALDDPAALKDCIAGCESLECLGPDEYAARIKIKAGPMQVALSGRFALSQRDPPSAYAISGRGEGPLGFVAGAARVTLAVDGSSTVMRYAGRAEIGGRLAGLGSRFLEGLARQVVEDFFARLAGKLAAAKERTGPANAAADGLLPEGRSQGQSQALLPAHSKDLAIKTSA